MRETEIERIRVLCHRMRRGFVAGPSDGPEYGRFNDAHEALCALEKMVGAVYRTEGRTPASENAKGVRKEWWDEDFGQCFYEDARPVPPPGIVGSRKGGITRVVEIGK